MSSLATPRVAEENRSLVPTTQLSGRMLYHVGGTGNGERVDISDLFVDKIHGYGMEVDYVIFSRDQGSAWQKTTWRNRKAYVVGTSGFTGMLGSVVNKLKIMWADLRTLTLALGPDYDIIQVRDRHFITPLLLLASLLTGKKFTVWSSYPYAEARMLDAKEGRARVPWLSYLHGKMGTLLLYRFVMPRADRVFVQSEQMAQDLRAFGVPRYKMTPIPMGVNKSLLDLHAYQQRPKTIAYLGTLIRVRRLDFLIDVLHEVKKSDPEARLLLIGDGEHPEDRKAIEQRITELGLYDSVTITGLLDMQEAQLLTASAALCVSPFYCTPILQSTSPTKMNEYMALGKPVVANSHPEQSAMIKASGAGFCVEWDKTAFADAIVTLLQDPELARNMGRRGKQYVREHRTYEQIAARLAPVYAELLR